MFFSPMFGPSPFLEDSFVLTGSRLQKMKPRVGRNCLFRLACGSGQTTTNFGIPCFATNPYRFPFSVSIFYPCDDRDSRATRGQKSSTRNHPPGSSLLSSPNYNACPGKAPPTLVSEPGSMHAQLHHVARMYQAVRLTRGKRDQSPLKWDSLDVILQWLWLDSLTTGSPLDWGSTWALLSTYPLNNHGSGREGFGHQPTLRTMFVVPTPAGSQ